MIRSLSKVGIYIYRKLLHYNTTLAIIFLFPFVLFSGELSDILTTSEAIYDMGFWVLMVRKALCQGERIRI